MDENKKVAQLGQTVYLDENEDFDSVILLLLKDT